MNFNRRLLFPALSIFLLLSVYLVTLKPVFLRRDGEWTRLLTHAASVAVVLREAGIVLEGNARTIPGLDAPVQWGMTIELPASNAGIAVRYHGETRYTAFPASGDATIQALLVQAGVMLADGEWVFADGVAVQPETILTVPPMELEIRAAVEFLLLLDGETTRHSAPGPTVGEALWQAGITLYAADQVVPAPATRLDTLGPSPALIEVVRSRPLVILADGKEVSVRAAGKTAGEALAAAGFALTGLDYSIPAENEPPPQDGRIRIVRVREEILREQSQIAFERETVPLPDLELDQTKVVQLGAYGIMESTIRIRYEDGVEVGRTSEGRQVVLPPQNRIVGYGTRIVVRTAETPDGTIEFYRAVPVYATSYSPCRLGVTPPRCNNITHSGKTLQKGMIAMVLGWYYLFQGQGVYVEGYGPATVEDSGVGPNAPYWIDLAYLDDEYVAWHRNTTLYFLTPAPANVPWILP
jgi:uncharacterized protein YabE (DUF348 family)